MFICRIVDVSTPASFRYYLVCSWLCSLVKLINIIFPSVILILIRIPCRLYQKVHLPAGVHMWETWWEGREGWRVRGRRGGEGCRSGM